ncbi:MAG: MerR family transcriptional regulator [Rubrivivax sp.]|nr:MerR family transcriptional regulator [Rubrivivax sp.]
MTDRPDLVSATLEDAWLTLDELCRAAAVSPQWVTARIDQGLLEAADMTPGLRCFDTRWVSRVSRMRRVELTFDAAPELAALVADLEDELARLRARLHRAGLG